MKQNSPENKQKILNYLQKHYKQTGHDFYFKSKHLKQLSLDCRVVGRLCMQLVRENKLKLWSDLSDRHEYTFVTNFRNNGGKTT
jgi:hypothetical protein